MARTKKKDSPSNPISRRSDARCAWTDLANQCTRYIQGLRTGRAGWTMQHQPGSALQRAGNEWAASVRQGKGSITELRVILAVLGLACKGLYRACAGRVWVPVSKYTEPTSGRVLNLRLVLRQHHCRGRSEGPGGTLCTEYEKSRWGTGSGWLSQHFRVCLRGRCDQQTRTYLPLF